MPKVSVIVPIYRVAAYLPPCVESILAQSEPDIEVLLVDDGSPDECPALMESFAARDARVRCLHQANGGLSAARNAGIAAAQGTYLLFVDGDDWIAPTLVADAVAAAERHGAEQVLWNYSLAYEDHVREGVLPLRDEVLHLDALGLPAYFYRYWFPYVHGQEAWSKLYRRDVIARAGLTFAPGSEVFAEDTLFSAMYLLHTRTLVALAQPYVFYRQRADGLMGAQKPDFARRMIALVRTLARYAERTGHARALRHVLPMLLYDLTTKGISRDPSPEAAARALMDARQDADVQALLRALLWGPAVTLYLLRTGRGLRTQWRARAFARAWLRGDTRRALALVACAAPPGG